MDEKKSTKQFFMVLALFIWGVVAIMTSAAVWNSKPATFIGIVAGIALAIHAACIYYAAKHFVGKEDTK